MAQDIYAAAQGLRQPGELLALLQERRLRRLRAELEALLHELRAIADSIAQQ